MILINNRFYYFIFILAGLNQTTVKGFIGMRLERDLFIISLLLFQPLEHVFKYTRYVRLDAAVIQKSIYCNRPVLGRVISLKPRILIKYPEIDDEIVRWQHYIFVGSFPSACW